MFQNKIISEYTLKLIKLCHFLKKFLEGTCPPPPTFNIQNDRPTFHAYNTIMFILV